jgi:hypothetical protein
MIATAKHVTVHKGSVVVTKEQKPNDGPACSYCKGARQVMVKGDNGEERPENCPVCRGSGCSGLVTK